MKLKERRKGGKIRDLGIKEMIEEAKGEEGGKRDGERRKKLREGKAKEEEGIVKKGRGRRIGGEL